MDVYVIGVDDSRVSILKNNDNRTIQFGFKRDKLERAEEGALIILSCGNCATHKSAAILTLASELEGQNIIICSWGHYQIKLVKTMFENAGTIVGYDFSNIYPKRNDEIISDDRKSLQIEFDKAR